LINMALARGIYFWGVKKVEYYIQFKVSSNGLEALKNIAAESGHEVEVVSEEGLPFLKNIVKRRLGFLTGALIFILALYFMSSFIWFVEVTGNNNVTTNQIIITAAKYGVYKGAAKWNFSRSEVEEAMLRDLSSLSYVKVDIKGVKANIEVVEKVLPSEEITGPCHIVASKDGIIEDILILEGQANVKKGDVVSKGDILISGIVFPEPNPYIVNVEENQEQEPYLVRARGNIKARVWYEGYGESKQSLEKVSSTDNKETYIFLETPWRNYKLKGNANSSFELFDHSVVTKEMNTPLGSFKIVKEIRQEKIRSIEKYSEKEAISIAQNKAKKILESQLTDGQKIVNEDVQVLSAPSDPIIRVKVTVEAIEDIAIAEPINVDER
ncbi:MAG: sporulation protein YqfD, partial [Syntrophomonadaceae bacterium]|nr:sporulation protein YqfD [Syntrophomonadaceae bacterium]